MTCAASTPGSARPARSSPLRFGDRDQPDRAVRGRPGHRRRGDRRRPRRVPLRRPGPLRRLRRDRADRGVLRPAQGLPAEQAREPAAEPRHPHGGDHPGPPPAQRGPRLLRQEAGRGQDPQRGPARAETAGQQRHLRLPAGRRPARRSPREGPGRAAGERLCRQRGRLAPQAPALRTSHSRTWSPPYDRGRRPAPGPAGAPGRAGHSPIAATLPPATPQVQVERPQRSEDERPGGAARRRPHSAARKARGQGSLVKHSARRAPQKPRR